MPDQKSSAMLLLRGYRREDLDALFRLDELCFESMFRFSKRDMKRYAEAKNAYVVLAEMQNELAGFCIVHLEGFGRVQAGYVVTLDVALEHRRAGVASRLMQEVERAVRAGGGAQMLLHVFAGNEAAIRFYQRLGYEHAGDAKDFYGSGIDGLVYRKGLTADDAGTG